MGFPSSSAGKESACNAGNPVQFLGWEDLLEKGRLSSPVFLGFPGGSAGKDPPTMQETWVPSLGWEVPGKGTVYPFQYSGLENSMDCIFMGSQRVGHD